MPDRILALPARIARWSLLSALIGALAGLAAAGLLLSLRWATAQFEASGVALLFLMPVATQIVFWLYARFAPSVARGTPLLIEGLVDNRGPVSARLLPMAFVTPLLGVLTGAPAASITGTIQLGGALADSVSRLLRLSPEDRRILLMAGLGAGFGAGAGAPLAGAVFGLELQRHDDIRGRGTVPCLVAALAANAVVEALGASPLRIPLTSALPSLSAASLALLIGLGVLFGLWARLFLIATQALRRASERLVGPRAWLQPALASVLIVGLIALAGWREAAGLSTTSLAEALHGAGGGLQVAIPKFVVTALAVSGGFRMGEVTPLFVMGSGLGVAAGGSLGVAPDVLAALGMTTVFGAAANVPLAAAILAGERFGPAVLPMALGVALVADLVSGPRGIYGWRRREGA